MLLKTVKSPWSADASEEERRAAGRLLWNDAAPAMREWALRVSRRLRNEEYTARLLLGIEMLLRELQHSAQVPVRPGRFVRLQYADLTDPERSAFQRCDVVKRPKVLQVFAPVLFPESPERRLLLLPSFAEDDGFNRFGISHDLFRFRKVRLFRASVHQLGR